MRQSLIHIFVYINKHINFNYHNIILTKPTKVRIVFEFVHGPCVYSVEYVLCAFIVIIPLNWADFGIYSLPLCKQIHVKMACIHLLRLNRHIA